MCDFCCLQASALLLLYYHWLIHIYVILGCDHSIIQPLAREITWTGVFRPNCPCFLSWSISRHPGIFCQETSMTLWETSRASQYWNCREMLFLTPNCQKKSFKTMGGCPCWIFPAMALPGLFRLYSGISLRWVSTVYMLATGMLQDGSVTHIVWKQTLPTFVPHDSIVGLE